MLKKREITIMFSKTLKTNLENRPKVCNRIAYVFVPLPLRIECGVQM